MSDSKKTKILYVITKAGYGGAGRYVYDLATHISRDHFDVVVACGGEGLLVEKLNKEGIRTINIPNLHRDINFKNELAAFKSIRQIYKQERPDVVHLNSSKIGALGALAGRLEKIPKIIFTAHGWAFNEDRDALWKIFVYMTSWITALLSHIVINISYAEEKQTLGFLFVGIRKVRMIYNAITNELFYEKSVALEQIKRYMSVSFEKDVLIIGSIGELHKNKGYQYALLMCKYLIEENKKFLYLIIGEGEERTSIERQIREDGLEKNVFLLGAIPDTSSGATLLKAFDIFLLPSTKEGMPYVLLEAGTAGVPIIATSVGGIPELISHEESGLLAEPKNEGALALQLEKIIFDQNKRDDYSSSLLKKISEEFNFDRMIKNTLYEYLN